MSDARRPWVIVYDIADDDRRARMARHLEAHGHRVQESVFELLATADEIERVLAGALDARRFVAGEDALRCYPLCGACLGGAKVFGRSAPVLRPGEPVVL